MSTDLFADSVSRPSSDADSYSADPFAHPFDDAPQPLDDVFASSSEFESAVEQASQHAEITLQPTPARRNRPATDVARIPADLGRSRRMANRNTLQVQGPRLAQSEGPTLDDLQLFDEDNLPVPSTPSDNAPSGVFDFNAPDSNPFSDGMDTPDAPGDFQVEPGTFPDAPMPQGSEPTTRKPTTETPPAIPEDATDLFDDATDLFDDPSDSDPVPSPFDETPRGPTETPTEPMPGAKVPDSPFGNEMDQPAIPDPDSNRQLPAETEEFDFPDSPFEPSDATPEPDPLTPGAPNDPGDFSRPEEPESILGPTRDATPDIPESTIDDGLGSPLSEDRDGIRKELDELEDRLGTPDFDGDPSFGIPSEQDEDQADDPFVDDEDEYENDEEAGPPCDRNYDERNCCEQDDDCRTAWERLTKRKVRDIQLDITPPFAPLPEDRSEALADKEERLADAPHRTWRDRSGRAVASGSMRDFRDGHVFVSSVDGRIASIPFLDLSHDDLCFVTAWWGLPGECTVQANDNGIRDWRLCTFTWKASALCHKPLYFEDVQLERYGHSSGPILQPLATTAHFFGNVLLLPYNMGTYPPNECRFPLGRYRPGSCAPWLVPAFPLSERGAKAELITLFALWGFAA